MSVKPGHLEQLSGQKCARCPEKRDTGNTGGQLERKRGWGERAEKGDGRGEGWRDGRNSGGDDRRRKGHKKEDHIMVFL